MKVFDIPELVNIILSYLSPYDQLMLLCSKRKLMIMFSSNINDIRQRIIDAKHSHLSKYLNLQNSISYEILLLLLVNQPNYFDQTILTQKLIISIQNIIYYLILIHEIHLPNRNNHYLGKNILTSNKDKLFIQLLYTKDTFKKHHKNTHKDNHKDKLEKLLSLYGKRIQEIGDKLSFIKNRSLIRDSTALSPLIYEYQYFLSLVNNWFNY